MQARDADERIELADALNAAVREAGALALSMFGTQVKTWTKGQGSPVSDAQPTLRIPDITIGGEVE